MKTYKKLLMGIALLMSVAVSVSVSHKALALTPDNKYLSACVVNILTPSNTSDFCKVDSSSGGPIVIYGGLEASEDLKTATYKGSTTLDKLTSNGVTLNVPRFIEILDSSGQNFLFKQDLVDRNAACGTITHTSLVGNTQDQFSDVKQPYVVYTASGATNSKDYTCNNTTFLVTLNKDGSLQLLSVVDDTIQKGNFIYAVKIDNAIQTANAVTGQATNKGDSCTGGADCVAGVCSKDNGDCTSAQQPTCESNFDSGFEWIICGGLKLADAAAGGFSNFVDSQLCFNTGASSTGGVRCGGNDNLNDNVKTAWGIFKNIATAVLVIVMLVMVISQAIGGGPFDAYTVRKMLPKLVAAVILMQLSWVLFKWTIDISNDFGKGIQDLLYAPFGGSSNMHLDKLVGNAVQTHTTGTNDTWAFFTILAGLGGAIANLPGLLTLALFAVVALATAFFVLILRKVLIILLVMLAPVALIAWILPGTQRYWKMWQENFTKLLLMFPLIMALIAGGRIFAYIVSGGTQPASGLLPHFAVTHIAGLPVPYIASVTSFADIAIIVFAYFGPYLLLPKAFTWGGQFMSAAASQVNERLSKPATEKGREGVKGISERYHGRFGKAYDPEAFIGKRAFNRLASGHFIPTKRSQRLAIAAGDKFSQERDEQALAKIKRMGETVMRDGYTTFERNKDGEMLDAAGNVTSDKSKAAVKKLSGVGAMKQMWVDLAEKGDSTEAKMAIRQLTATSSWPEIQGSFTESGKKVIDTQYWAPSITTSPEDYPRVLRSRVDATPHIDNAAREALETQLKITPGMADIEQQQFKSAFRVQYAIEKQMSNEDFATQSDGFWEEAARMASAGVTYTDPKTGAVVDLSAKIQSDLKSRFQAIHEAGPTARQQMLGHLRNGGKLEQYVNEALGAGVGVTGAVGGSTAPTSVDDFMH